MIMFTILGVFVLACIVSVFMCDGSGTVTAIRKSYTVNYVATPNP